MFVGWAPPTKVILLHCIGARVCVAATMIKPRSPILDLWTDTG